MVIAEVSADTMLLLILALKVLILVIGGILAYLVKKGHIDGKTVENSKDMANALAGAIDKFKGADPDAAKFLLRDVVSNIGDKKPVLDAFLKAMNLNAPNGKKPKETEDG